MLGPLGTVIKTLLPFICFYFLFWLMFFKPSGKKFMPITPTNLPRGSRGPYRYSSKSAGSLWSAFALAMALSSQLVLDSGSIYHRIATDATGTPTTRVVVMLLAIVGCLLALIMTLPKGIGHPALDLVSIVVAFIVAAVDPWFGSIGQAIVVLILLGYRGNFGAVLQWGSVIVSYYVMSSTRATTWSPSPSS